MGYLGVEMSNEVRALLELAHGEGLAADEVERELVQSAAVLTAETEVGVALRAIALELRATRLVLEAGVLASLAPPTQFGGDLVEVEAGWYRIELMGHRRRHGYLEPVRLAGRQLVEIRTPIALIGLDGDATGELDEQIERYAAAAIFSLAGSSKDDATEEARQDAERSSRGYVAFDDGEHLDDDLDGRAF